MTNKTLRNLVAAIAMTAGLVAMADNALVVHSTTGQVPFALPTVQRLIMGDNALSVFASGEYQFPYLEIEKIDFVSQTVGDANGDGTVDIADVNTVIDMMLGKAASSAAGDASVADITFVEIAQATTTITLIDADDSSVRANVTMTKGTRRYEVACYAASETPDNIEAYIQANKKFNRKQNGKVEFVDLTPSTSYVIAALAYDEYDLPCEVSTLEFATAERVISEPAKIGDFLYRDGSWSTELKANKTPVGIIYSLTPTDADRALGYTNGYAIALKDAAYNTVWSTEGGENESGSSIQGEQDLTDREGLAHTTTLLENADIHPAAQAASQYDIAPYGTSGWYLPAIGQWVEVLRSLGGLSDDAFSRNDSGQGLWEAEAAAAAVSQLNEQLARAGQGQYTPINQTYYWSSSERSMMSAYYLFYNPSYYMSLMNYYKNGQFTVRPVIAF